MERSSYFVVAILSTHLGIFALYNYVMKDRESLQKCNISLAQVLNRKRL